MPLKMQAFLLLSLISAGISTGQASERFEMPGKPYSVIISGTPDCAAHQDETPIGTINRHACVYYDSGLGGGYTFEYFSLPVEPEASKAQHVLMGAATGAAQATNSEIIREREIQIDGHPALEVLLLTRSKGYLTHARYVLVGRDLIRISVDGGKRIHDSPNTPSFLESLLLSDNSVQDAPNNSFKPTPLRGAA